MSGKEPVDVKVSEKRKVKLREQQAADEASADAVEQGAPAPEGAVERPTSLADEPSYLDDLRRMKAEFDNYRKRMMKEQAAVAGRAEARLVALLLPILDDFERAVAHGEGGEGVELVFKQLKEVLAKEGVEEIPAEGVPFDPAVHEGMAAFEDPDVSEPTCREVYRKGYRFKGDVLRPAMVVVARPPEADAEHQEAQEEDRRADDGGEDPRSPEPAER